MSLPTLTLLSHPYERLFPVGGPSDLREAARRPGSAVVWRLDSERYGDIRRMLERRPGGLALIVLLPEAVRLDADPDIVHGVQRCRPHGILPSHEHVELGDIISVLRRPPLNLPVDVTDYLVWRGLLVDRETTHLLRRIVELSEQLRSITALSRSLYLSRRALGRRFLTRGLPVPSHWLQLSRILRVASRLQNESTSIQSIAYASDYPDGFSLSNQMQRLIGYRPTQVREHLGWEWILESWLRKEAEAGGLAPSAAREITEGDKAPSGPPVRLPTPRKGRPRRPHRSRT